MEPTDFECIAASFAAFHRHFAPLFGRKEARRRGEQYLRGLLVQQTDRRNAENLAEAVEGATPRALQRFLTEAPWPTAPVVDALQAYLGPRLSVPEGVFVVDESGFPKQGKKSVGVARQYCGRLGKVANCQMGVFLAYVSGRGRALIDTRLYLPHAWTDDRARCEAVGVPAGVTFQTKAELALAMLARAKGRGHLAGRWVTADEQYGQIPSFRDALDAAGWWYVAEVPRTTPVFTQEARTAVPAGAGRGRKPTRRRLLAGEEPARAAESIAAELAVGAWQVLTVAEGAQGPRRYQFAARRVWESREGLPGRACWLVLRRNLDGSELKLYLSNAPRRTRLRVLGHVGAQRWPIETELQTGKGEAGLAEYEVRSWAGWHHHVTLALLAAAFLLTVQQDWGEKDARPDPPTGEPGPACLAPPAHLDARRPVPLARRHPTTQPTRQTLPRQTPLTPAA